MCSCCGGVVSFISNFCQLFVQMELELELEFPSHSSLKHSPAAKFDTPVDIYS